MSRARRGHVLTGLEKDPGIAQIYQADLRPPAARGAPRIPVLALGMSLGLFLAISFALCVAFGLVFPGAAMFRVWIGLLPGFIWLSWPSFLLGFAESFAYGWYVALIFAPLFNVFSARWSR